jgi:hypothetical protein
MTDQVCPRCRRTRGHRYAECARDLCSGNQRERDEEICDAVAAAWRRGMRDGANIAAMNARIVFVPYRNPHAMMIDPGPQPVIAFDKVNAEIERLVKS